HRTRKPVMLSTYSIRPKYELWISHDAYQAHRGACQSANASRFHWKEDRQISVSELCFCALEYMCTSRSLRSAFPKKHGNTSMKRLVRWQHDGRRHRFLWRGAISALSA